MVSLSDHTLITEQEAAALLQPYMPSKSAEKWLAQDQRNNPSIPYFLSQGQLYYRESDVVLFIRQVLNPSAQFIRIHDHLSAERRRAPDRRKLAVRRKITGAILQASIERRRPGQADRRQMTYSSRRTQPATPQSASH